MSKEVKKNDILDRINNLYLFGVLGIMIIYFTISLLSCILYYQGEKIIENQTEMINILSNE